jgi:ATP-dependent DNA ligase
VNGQFVRRWPLVERKRRLVQIMPRIESRLLYLDYIVERGHDLYRVACERDLEGILAKWPAARSRPTVAAPVR